MRIAMLGHKRIPGREGGIEVVVEELSTRMVEKGHQVTVFNRHKKGIVSPEYYKGVRIVDVPTIERQSTDAGVYSLLASLKIAFGRYDIVHYHAIGPSAFLIIPHLFHKRIIVTVHGLNYMTPKWKGFAAKFIRFGERMTAKYADEIIVLSNEQKKYFKYKYNRETLYIPNGTVIENKEEPDEIVKRYGLNKGEYLLYLSRVVPGKGLEYLLDAYRDVPGNLPLVIAGGTEYVSDFRRMIEEKASLDPRVKLIGFVKGKVLRELYSNARLFVFPSEAEGMPMCLLEALSFDCPCLTSNIPENMEVGRDFVVLFESTNVEDLRKKIIDCINNADLFKSGSREYIEAEYRWDAVVEKTLKCYVRETELL